MSVCVCVCLRLSVCLSLSMTMYISNDWVFGGRGVFDLIRRTPKGSADPCIFGPFPPLGKREKGQRHVRARARTRARSLHPHVCVHVPIASFRQVHAAHILGFCLLPPMFFFERWWGAMGGLGFERASWCLALSCLALSLVVDVFSVASVHFRDFFLGD